MKKFIPLLLLLSISLFGCMGKESTSEVQSDKEQTPAEINESIEELVVSLIESFGNKLQNVSLLGPKTELEKSMKENYGGIVSPELIEQWLKDPLSAPGRLTSSPWPDRIDITDTQRQSDQKYAAKGEIVEVTGTEVVDRRPIQLFVEKVGEQWMITGVKINQDEMAIRLSSDFAKWIFI